MTQPMRRLGILLNDSFSVYREHLALFALIILVVHCVLLSIGIFWHPPIVLPDGANTFTSILSLDLVIWLLISLVLTLFCNLAVLIAAHVVTDGESIIWSMAYREAYEKFLPYLLTMFLSLMLILLGFFAFIIPGIILMGLFIFVPFCIVVDGFTGLSALGYSIRLINSNKSKILGNITVIVLIVFGVNAAAYIFGAFTQSVLMIKVIQFATKVFAVWPTIFMMMLYKDTKEAMQDGGVTQSHPIVEG